MELHDESPRTKALEINLNTKIFGTIAEIGAGQEVARNIFVAGGSSGTIAKTISAYDTVLSDKIYGHTGDKRYVSKSRLKNMLNVEFDSLIEILHDKRDKETCYFVFANTVTAINFTRDNEPHGWIGIKYQLEPQEEPNEIILHVRLFEPDNVLQQRTLGILGINLIHAAYYHWEKPNKFLRSLLDYISTNQVEVDMITMFGPHLNFVDNRLLGVQLVKNKMTEAVLFNRGMRIEQPSDYLYKKNVFFLRGKFRPITYLHFDMIQKGFTEFKKDIEYTKENTLIICEISLNNLYEEGELDEQDFLDRVKSLSGIGMNVMISSLRYHYELISYFSNFKIIKMGGIAGTSTVKNVMNNHYYKHLRGGIVEAISHLFIDNSKVYIYPTILEESKDLFTQTKFDLPKDIKSLVNYLYLSGKLIEIKNVNKSNLHIHSEDVLNKIRLNDDEWEKMVPRYVSRMIKANNLFGYKSLK